MSNTNTPPISGDTPLSLDVKELDMITVDALDPITPTQIPRIHGHRDREVIVLTCYAPHRETLAALEHELKIISDKELSRKQQPGVFRSPNLSRWANKNRKTK